MTNNPKHHFAAAGAFVALAVLWSYPLATDLSTHLPGTGAGDNVNFLWNFWWMREALSSPDRFFFTPYLFAPFGVDLTLHTHTALPAFVGATLLNPLPVLTTLNLTIFASMVLNGLCTYALAWRLTRDAAASTIAGIVFAGSPYLSAHLHGHFNLTTAWTLPLFALTAGEAMRGSIRWAVAAGVVLGATAYIDYYYVVYQIAFAVCACLMTARDWSIALAGPTPRTLRLASAFAILALVDVAVIAGITATGGFDTVVGPVRLRAREVFNPLQVLWVLVAVALYLRWRPRIRIRRVQGWNPRAALTALGTMAAILLVLAAPIAWNGAQLVLRGEYVSQTYFWRNAPKGIDIATLVIGNPFHGAWGDAVRYTYQWLGIDAIESGAWLGVLPVVLATRAIRSSWTNRAVGYWSAIGAVFFVWALGPHLMAFGVNTGMILPQTLLRYIPIAANARIPGRAIVIVYLALAILGAIAVAAWQSRSRRRGWLLVLIALLIIIDYIPAPFPLIAIDRPAIYETLRDRPEAGVLCELPLGIRDSFTGRGFLDHRVLAYQMIHRRPIVGGVVSRLSPSVIDAYGSDPLIDALLTMSERREPATPPPDRTLAVESLSKHNIAFVMLNRATAGPALIDYVERELPVVRLADEGTRSLYVVMR